MKRVSWLNLHVWIPQRDVRKLIYAKLTYYDMYVVQHAHLSTVTQMKHNPNAFTTYCAEHGYLTLLKWAIATGFKLRKGWDGATAVRSGHLPVLRWLHEQSYTFDGYTCYAAAHYGHLEILKWAKGIGCHLGPSVCSEAALIGRLDIIQWARLKGCTWNAGTCYSAAHFGHFHVLRWARENGCPWDKLTPLLAAENGHLDIFKWVITNGCPFDVEECAKTSHAHVKIWINVHLL